MNGGETGITTTAEVMEFARDIGRTWGDLHEIFVWEDGVKLVENTYTISKPFTKKAMLYRKMLMPLGHLWVLNQIG